MHSRYKIARIYPFWVYSRYWITYFYPNIKIIIVLQIIQKDNFNIKKEQHKKNPTGLHQSDFVYNLKSNPDNYQD